MGFCQALCSGPGFGQSGAVPVSPAPGATERKKDEEQTMRAESDREHRCGRVGKKKKNKNKMKKRKEKKKKKK